MIRKSIYSLLALTIFYFGFVYLVAIGSLGSYEGPGEISNTSTPKEIVSSRIQKQLDDKNKVDFIWRPSCAYNLFIRCFSF